MLRAIMVAAFITTSGTATVKDSIFIDNSAGYEGGGICNLVR